jgi:hypothetical protein
MRGVTTSQEQPHDRQLYPQAFYFCRLFQRALNYVVLTVDQPEHQGLSQENRG